MAWNQLAPPAWKGASPRRDPTLKPLCSRPVSPFGCQIQLLLLLLLLPRMMSSKPVHGQAAEIEEFIRDAGQIVKSELTMEMAAAATFARLAIEHCRDTWFVLKSKEKEKENTKAKGSEFENVRLGCYCQNFASISTSTQAGLTELWGGTYIQVYQKLASSVVVQQICPRPRRRASDNVCDSFIHFLPTFTDQIYIVLANL
jgi:hypothetical protein